MSEPKGFEASLDVLWRNRVAAYGAVAATLLGLLGFVLFLAGALPVGALGLHLLALGAAVGWMSAFQTLWAQRRAHRVRFGMRGVTVDGSLAVPAEKLASGYYQPRGGASRRWWGRNYRSSVRLLDKHGRIVFEAEPNNEEDALAMLAAVGLDPSHRRVAFKGASPMVATTPRGIVFVLACAIPCFERSVPPVVAAALVVLFSLGAIVPTRIIVGVDGILVRWLWHQRFLANDAIQQVFAVGEREIRVLLRDGTSATIYTSMPKRNNFGHEHDIEHRNAIVTRIIESIAASRARLPKSDVSALVARGARSAGEWLASLRALKEAGSSYRSAPVRDDDLWSVVENPAAQPDARAGAALLLRGSLDAVGRQRLRIAAEATASPRLRVVLERSAEEAEVEVDSAALELVRELRS